MPTYRITAPKKRTKRGRQSSSRRRYRSPAPSRMRLKPLALMPHNFVERLSSDVIQIDTEANATGLFKTFNLDQISQASNYKALFEYYTINKVVATFRYKVANPANTNEGATNYTPVNEVNPLLVFKVDHNDNSSDSLSALHESAKTREHQLSNDKPNFSIQIKPAVQTEAYKSALASTYIPKWGQQLSTDDGTVPHYGLKVYAIGFKDSTWNPGSIEVTYKMYFTMKNNE